MNPLKATLWTPTEAEKMEQSLYVMFTDPEEESYW